MNFAVIIPVGPSKSDLERTADLLDSLEANEPATPLVLLIDDGGKDRSLARHFKYSGRMESIFNTRGRHGIGPTSGLAAGMLLTLAWLRDRGFPEFIVKLDTDALVIAPFAARLREAFAAAPEAGMLGLFDWHTDGRPRDLTGFARMIGKLAAPAAIWKNPATPLGFVTLHLGGRRAEIRRQIKHAIARGYRPAEFILGGAYAISGEAMRRMSEAGYYNDPMLWLGTHFSEDIILSMYVRAVGLELRGHCGNGEVFAVEHYGLPDTPECLAARGFSIIHSIKSDPKFTEKEIREWFRSRRATSPR